MEKRFLGGFFKNCIRGKVKALKKWGHCGERVSWEQFFGGREKVETG